MSLIYKTSNVCAKFLSTKVPNDKFPTVQDQIQVYSYGFQAIIGALVKGFLLVTISYLLGILTPAITLTLTFVGLRVIAGGYHMTTYSRCMVVSLVMFLVSALIAQYTYQYWTVIELLTLLTFSVLAGIYIAIRYIPRVVPTKPITKSEQIIKFKRWSLIYLWIWFTVMIILITTHMTVLVLASSFGLLLELWSISELGYQFFFHIENFN